MFKFCVVLTIYYMAVFPKGCRNLGGVGNFAVVGARGPDEKNSGPLERARLANQIQGFRISDRCCS